MWEYFGTARWENPVINFLIGDWSGLKREEVIRAIGETKFYNHCRQNVHFFHRGKLSCILQFQAYSWPMQLSWGPRKGDGFSPISHSSPIIASLIAGEKNIQRYKWRKFKCIQNNGGGGGGVYFLKREKQNKGIQKNTLYPPTEFRLLCPSLCLAMAHLSRSANYRRCIWKKCLFVFMQVLCHTNWPSCGSGSDGNQRRGRGAPILNPIIPSLFLNSIYPGGGANLPPLGF